MAAVHGALDRLWAWSGDALDREPNAAWRAEFATAVAEIAANIIRHACPAVGDRCEPHLVMAVHLKGIEATFTDRGVPCRVPIPVGPPIVSPDQPKAWPESGLGLGLARAAVDDLRYERTPAGENRWRLCKRLVTPRS